MYQDTDFDAQFEQLFREQHSRLYLYAHSILGNDDDSRDVVSEAFLGAWKNRNGIDPDKLPVYLFTSVRNKCLTQVRKQRHFYPISEETLQHLAAETEEEWHVREERISQIEQQIKTLNSRTRHVLEQCYYQHHSYAVVAKQLGITTDGVKKHITTALKHLRANFNIDKHKK